MTAIRTARAAEGKFVQIANAALQDQRLSFTARGILGYVLSLPPDQHITAEWLETRSPCSRRVVRAALKELETLGYYRKSVKSGGRNVWMWEHVMSDAPMTAEAAAAESSQVSSSDHLSATENTPDDNRQDKYVNTATANTEKTVQGLASRRAHASSASVNRTVTQAVAEVREAIEMVHGEREASALTDNEVLGLYFAYAHRKKRQAANLVAYMTKILEDAPYLDTFMANVAPVCCRCQQWEDGCECSSAAA